ncbi:23S rRNA (uracil(1939)-C(5))-methyltransferase RlmD [Vibrio sp. SS-MA-C1-2]|uniref:23S rRNA (uracil(1939)-C(5))-methyltransferase RlmD n=1 Tax=Vibrio sp. SS-MA-C1-2 TaxID=2908646 RepID=UPI001F34AE69|nr:23S rRNA (uracil(1939)-C(5))-methyltransferase RlmD [Vibrio sp. SS-MA-C1-2]UJF19027.1 23S rRNA (uracil(1939)-C(5))-methyltransferase RlmD [Vibrio sp. SS-MA-C1-2]
MARFFKPQKTKKIDTKHKPIMIERLDHQGIGIGRLNKKAVFVEGALPTEEVLIQLVEEKKQYAKAKLIKVLTPSEQRVPAGCQYYGECGGCNLQHFEHQAQVASKQQSLVQLISKLTQQQLDVETILSEPVMSDSWHYRRSARISIYKGKVGYRQRKSNQIVDITHCPVLALSLETLIEPLKEQLKQLKGYRDLGHMELVAADNVNIMLLRHLVPLSEDDKAELIRFSTRHNLTIYLSAESGQVEHLVGDRPYYRISDCQIDFEPQDFIQVNKVVNDQMVEQALNWLAVSEQDRVLDLFCGLGNFSLPIAKRAELVVGIEGVPEMVNRAQKNAAINGLTNCHFYHTDLDQQFLPAEQLETKFNKVLLDPARAGAAGVMSHIVELKPEKIVYVSCNPATLARDSQLLLTAGYQISQLGMLDMFPQTGHLESMALFTKKR